MRYIAAIAGLLLAIAIIPGATGTLAETARQKELLLAQAPPPPPYHQPTPPQYGPTPGQRPRPGYGPGHGPGPRPGPGGGRANALAQCTQQHAYCTQMCNTSYYGEYRNQCNINCNAVYVACVNRANTLP